MANKRGKRGFRGVKARDMIRSHVMEVTPEKVDVDQPLPTTTYATPVDKLGSSAKKRGRPSKDDSTSDQTTSDAIPAKIQKSMDNLNLSDVSISDSSKSGNSKRTTPVSTESKSIKGKKGFQKRSTVARALFTASQELMPPPATTNLLDQTMDSTTSDLTLPDLTPNSNATFDSGSAVADEAKLKCVAVHPSFVANFYSEEVRSRNIEMQASDFMLNPRNHSLSNVSAVFIPVLLRDLKPVPAAMLRTSIGHWVLGVYHSREHKVVFFDPYGRSITDIAKFQLHRAIATLPPAIKTDDFSIECKTNLYFNTQTFDDATNCGYYVCLYTE
uniref:Ubiquitin-like protease family profile domain-containing protein n=1 Tax=Romanomermis culicivorax TaxID=13658 RepID=A0A915J2S9_ROMCU